MGKLLRCAIVAAAVATLSASAIHTSLIVEADGAPPVPHGTSGKEQCLTCHGAQGLNALPANHASFTNDVCLSCHMSAPVASPPTSTPPAAPPVPTSQVDNCLSCHGQPGLNMAFANGEKLSLYVEPQTFTASIHGEKLVCVDCHNSIVSYPHPKVEISSLRGYRVGQYEVCKKCHFVNYTKTLDSIHYTLLAKGDANVPLCTDCHGAHDVTSPDKPRSTISRTCSQCHTNVFTQYAASVHGRALIEENNYDVPVCTDCHSSHTIEDPRTAAFRLRSVELCSSCHSNEKLMQKYDISSNVVKSYLEDFHGRTVALVDKQDKDIWVQEAVCTDCHGVHDIQKVDSPNSPVLKANVAVTCGKCHEGATPNFPAAWLSHYEPGPTRNTLVYAVRWLYRIFIPFMLLGLSIHLVLDFWRTITNR